MRRPFATRYSSTRAFGLLEVRIAFQSVPDAGALAAVNAVHRSFLALANAGAMCGEGIAPERSGIGGAEVSRAGAVVTWTFSQVWIDPHSVTIVVNLVHYLHENVLAVAELYLDWEMTGRMADPSQVRFPSICASVPFDVSIAEDAAVFDIVLDFAGPQPPGRVEAAGDLVRAWFVAINLGAYGDESSPAPINRALFAPEPITVCDDALVWYLDRWASTPFALDGLVNVVCRIDRTCVPIVALEVSE